MFINLIDLEKSQAQSKERDLIKLISGTIRQFTTHCVKLIIRLEQTYSLIIHSAHCVLLSEVIYMFNGYAETFLSLKNLR